MNKSLVLTGMMGVGKSTIGRLIAKRLKVKFIDVDKVIERRERKSIKRIFDDNGETYCYAVLIDGLLEGVCATQKQFKGSNTPGGLNVNNLNSEMLTDFGKSPTFYSVIVEIEKASEEMTKKAIKQGV